MARALVSEIIGVVADDDEDDKPEEKEAPVPAAIVPAAPAEVKAPKEEPKKEEKKEEKKEAPVQAKAKVEEEKDKPAPAAKEEEVPAIVPPEPGTKEAVVDTDILASVTFAGIEVPTGIMSMDDVGEMSDQEKANLAQLF